MKNQEMVIKKINVKSAGTLKIQLALHNTVLDLVGGGGGGQIMFQTVLEIKLIKKKCISKIIVLSHIPQINQFCTITQRRRHNVFSQIFIDFRTSFPRQL